MQRPTCPLTRAVAAIAALVALAAALGASLPCCVAAAEAAPTVTNLAPNPGFELDANDDGAPDGWRPASGDGLSPTLEQDTPGRRFAWATDTIHGGKRALAMAITDNTQWPQWVSEEVPVHAGSAYTLEGWIKTRDALSGCLLYVQWLGKGGRGLAQTVTPIVLGTHDWVLSRAVMVAPAEAATASLRMIQYYNGTSWVDDLRFVEGSLEAPRARYVRIAADPFRPGRVVVGAEFDHRAAWKLDATGPGTPVHQSGTDTSVRLELPLPVGAYRFTFRYADPSTGVAAAPVLASAIVAPQGLPARYTVWPEHNLHKVRRNEPPGPPGEVRISAAANEWEPFQLVITPGRQDLRAVQVTTSDLRTAAGAVIPATALEVCREHYINITTPAVGGSGPGWYPDALPPVTGPFDVKAADGNQPLWVTVRVPADARAGVYAGHVEIAPAHAERVTVPLRLTVRRFALTPETHTATCFLIWTGHLARYYGVPTTDPKIARLYRLYYEFLRDRRISADVPPGGLATEEGARYLDDPRVASMRVPYTSDVAKLKQTVELIKRKGWHHKAYFYVVDEPSPADYPRVKQAWEVIKQVDPAIPYVVTIQPVPGLYGAVTAWCPISKLFDPGVAQARQALGEQVWWYTALDHSYPGFSYHVDYEAMETRFPAWEQMLWNIRGVLYWDVNDWILDHHKPTARVLDPWTEVHNFSGAGANAEGFLLYPGDPVGIEGPVSSLRLEQLREGLEDYEYLWTLGQETDRVARRLGVTDPRLMGERRAKEMCRGLVPDPTTMEYVRDADNLLSLREAVAAEIEALKGPVPLLVATDPPAYTPTRQVKALLFGVTEPGAQVRVNGLPVVPKPNGAFSTELRLRPGDTTVRIEAAGKRGNVVQTRLLRLLG